MYAIDKKNDTPTNQMLFSQKIITITLNKVVTFEYTCNLIHYTEIETVETEKYLYIGYHVGRV